MNCGKIREKIAKLGDNGNGNGNGIRYKYPYCAKHDYLVFPKKVMGRCLTIGKNNRICKNLYMANKHGILLDPKKFYSA